MLIPLTLWHPRAFMEQTFREIAGYYMFYGFIVVTILYNALLGFSLKDQNYLKYILYITSFCLFQLSYQGIAFQHIWPTSPWFNDVSITFFAAISTYSLCAFTRQFLHTSKNTPVIDKFLNLLLYSSLALTGLAFLLPYYTTMLIITPNTAVVGVLIMIASLHALKAGYRPARFFVLAFSAFLCGGVMLALKSMGFLPSNFITEHGIQLGSVLQVLLLSLAVGDRVLTNMALAHKKVKELNDNLEEKVRQKTWDLEQQKEKLESTNLHLKKLNQEKGIILGPAQ